MESSPEVIDPRSSHSGVCGGRDHCPSIGRIVVDGLRGRSPGAMRDSGRRVDSWIWSVHKPLGLSADGRILSKEPPAFTPGCGWNERAVSASRLWAGCHGNGFPPAVWPPLPFGGLSVRDQKSSTSGMVENEILVGAESSTQ